MKTQSLLFLFGGLMALFFTACQKDDVIKPNYQDVTLTSRAAPSFSYSANPTNVNEVVTITFDAGNGANCGHIQIQVLTPSGADWVQILGPTLPVNGVASVNYTPTEVGFYQFRARYTRTGSPASCPFDNTGWVEADPQLEVISACTNELTASVSCSNDECNRSATFSFTAEEDGPIVIQGGLTRFTTICTASASEGLTQNTTHPGVQNSNSNVTRWEGNVIACETYTVTITWTSANDDEEITGEWTAQRNDVVLASIAPLTCP